MATEIITKEDLNEFRELLLEDIKQLLGSTNATPQGKWLKSYQVRNLLKISAGTLQNLRVNGTIPYTQIGSIIYYKSEDINRVLQDGFKTKRSK
ncbi:helix-turn-helix domain-containing protein [Mucilaginibacter gossypii]|uniref:helix-turn-helix domain-containing protein n=1 Tax=Mucilaginibacter gossypii TaxID=551996 RepID=UPI000DCBADD1|nr:MULTISPECIES: helix-turn-helix domain-containing protein [Mucilaginibacter]QTE36378.1 helix-turn-helix domain-containing protein [Mucilaginibacter gossypii]RAV55874.1 DNA-binding protein [Mucilaginibacter rubeus]